MRKKAQQRFGVVLTALLLLLAVLAFNAWKEKKSLAKHKKLTAANITSASENLIGGRQIRLFYSYSVNQNNFTGQILVEDLESFGERNFMIFNYRDFRFPLIYDSLHPEINKLLIMREDWANHGIPLTDSLRRQFTIIESAR
ncbi:hypothetical protein [Pseudobacter ginsenosidimutans]|uniref:Uncharacterized protein n=1 Tax=Pseudobacter ginsenosidimutans TaxID=661488 RepID=A0A4Q7MCF3_9BACT|nr:hypothetical protein [Pseudobacter ginsenosidimutans]QEC45253.1 hypothetical protein FSB84_27490 [Pseudobacter ginsenosidimutans]RZS65521.1 hypothetical protein EV199_5695 [Pseudobacter ginsenosidimutans]